MRQPNIRKIRWIISFTLTVLLGLSSFETESRAFGLSAPSIYFLDISTRWMLPALAPKK